MPSVLCLEPNAKVAKDAKDAKKNRQVVTVIPFAPLASFAPLAAVFGVKTELGRDAQVTDFLDARLG